jgi:hypothetical protein
MHVYDCYAKCGKVPSCHSAPTSLVTTLALGSRPKQGLTKVQAKSEARESHFMLMGV